MTYVNSLDKLVVQILEFDTPHDILIRTLKLASILASNIAPLRSLEVKILNVRSVNSLDKLVVPNPRV